MRKCAVSGCKGNLAKNGVSLHRFPLQKACLLQSWLEALQTNGCDMYSPNKNSYLCSQHFRTEDFEDNGKKNRLKPNAVPSLQLFAPNACTKKKKKKRKDVYRKLTLATIDMDHNYCIRKSEEKVDAEMLDLEGTFCDRDLYEGEKLDGFTNCEFVNPWQSRVIEACFLVPVICDLGEDT